MTFHAVSAVVQGKRVELDPLLPDVLLFPAGADLHEHPLVASHCLILQVRAVPGMPARREHYPGVHQGCSLPEAQSTSPH